MAQNKLDRFREQILMWHSEAQTIRAIAFKLSELANEKIAASSVHCWLKVNTNGKQENVSPGEVRKDGKSESAPENAAAGGASGTHRVALRLGAIEERLELIEAFMLVVCVAVYVFVAWQLLRDVKTVYVMLVAGLIGAGLSWFLRRRMDSWLETVRIPWRWWRWRRED